MTLPKQADTDRVTRIVQQTFSKKLCAFVPRHITGTGSWALGIAVLGEAGYHPMDPDELNSLHYDVVANECNRLNALLLGAYDETTRIAIVADTMNRSRRDDVDLLIIAARAVVECWDSGNFAPSVHELEIRLEPFKDD